MKKNIMFIIYVIVVLLVAVLVAGQLGVLSGKQPQNIGVANGLLKAPSKTRNSVSSQTALHAGNMDAALMQYAVVEPLVFKNNSAANSMQALVVSLKGIPGVTIVDAKPDYIYAQATTPVLKFVDDMEFWVNPTKGAIDVRSASRLGREDFGVNRKRMEAIRAAYALN